MSRCGEEAIREAIERHAQPNKVRGAIHGQDMPSHGCGGDWQQQGTGAQEPQSDALKSNTEASPTL